jgi:hypothetical protein
MSRPGGLCAEAGHNVIVGGLGAGPDTNSHPSSLDRGADMMSCFAAFWAGKQQNVIIGGLNRKRTLCHGFLRLLARPADRRE